MADVVIRPQALDDVEFVLDVLERVAAEGRWIGAEPPLDRAGRGQRIRDGLQRPTAYGGFVADDDGTVVGTIDLHLAPYGVVDIGMALVDGYRGKGLGTGLLEHGIGWARTAGAHKMALQVWPHNEVAIALYTKLGFVEEGRLRHHYRRRNGDIWDAVIMGLLL